MTAQTNSSLPVIVAGGGIGGLATALALVRQGFKVQVLEQAHEIGEIGAGIQLGPNAFHAFDALGVGEKTRSRGTGLVDAIVNARWLTKAITYMSLAGLAVLAGLLLIKHRRGQGKGKDV